MKIDANTTDLELAALISQALEAAGIIATLVGGGAVSIYCENEYKSLDLDFVTAERIEKLKIVLEPLGFALGDDRRHFVHPNTSIFVEFPPSPLEFGNRMVQYDEIPKLETPWGPLRVITPTLCVMDRLAAFWYWSDRQSWDQAVLVVHHADVDFDELKKYAKEEGSNPHDIDRLRAQAGK